ncbi:helix-turn-helix transcriptional regulator [Enterococcus sp. CSURQ0835]|uniref:helix-turn-helix transcriptional regulator n=1 Tax=Enterococcus sp. CSURQ0835 TaxID=2681394 RepID=UPI00135B9FEC|nr:response regulator transcription factor [Enterococcus sp. CSURQ0835]
MGYEYSYINMLPVKTIFDISFFPFTANTKHQIKESHHTIFYFVENGYLEISLNDKKLILQPNQCTILSGKCAHRFKTHQEAESKVLMLTFELFTEEAELPILFSQVFSLSDEQKSFLRAIILKAQHVYPQMMKNVFNLKEKITTARKSDERIVYLNFAELLLTLERDLHSETCLLPQNKTKICKNETVEQIIAYMETHLADNCTVEDFASQFYISPSYIKKIFKEHTGYSLINFYRTLKMEKAKEYIQTGNYNFTDIGNLLGYESIHHFSNTFKKYTGLSPTKYQRSVTEINQSN